MNSNIAIKVENVTKVYRLYDKPQDRLKEALNPFKKSYHHDFYALHDVSFEMKKGETVGIIGRNGAGKSTLLKIITGVLTPTNGNVEVNGKIASLLELGAGFNPEMTGLENIYLNGTLMGFTNEETNSKVDSIMNFADIGDFIHQPVKTYSSGMYARLAFAVAINSEPDILIVDEILGVGDMNFQLKCHKRMNEMREQGTSMLFVSHDTYTIKTICSKALYLKNGVSQKFGNSLEIVNFYLNDIEEKTPDIPLPKKEAKNSLININSINSSKPGEEIFLSIFDPLHIDIEYEILSDEIDEIVPVFNIYQLGSLIYVCGSTILMDHLLPIKVKKGINKFSLDLESLPLLTGKYRLRVAINEAKGLGILAEENEALYITIQDNHNSEGIIHLKRKWTT